MTRRTKRIVTLVCIGIVVYAALVVFEGKPTIYRLERLLDQHPPEAEVVRFLEWHRVPYSARPDGTAMTARIDVFGIFDTSRIYKIDLDANRRVAGYCAEEQALAP